MQASLRVITSCKRTCLQCLEEVGGLGSSAPGCQARACWDETSCPTLGCHLLLFFPHCGLSDHLLFLQPYVPKDPPVLRVTEGPFFSEVVAYYEHVHQVVRLYNLPGESCR